MQPLLTVVVPSYNVSHKISGCLSSLDALFKKRGDIEVIIVDDHSTDNTAVVLDEFASTRKWTQVIHLEKNTGSPSAPRNIGLDHSNGKYVWFQDADDSISVDGADEALRIAVENDADIVRGSLIRVTGTRQERMNLLPLWKESWNKAERIEAIVGAQSANIPGPIKVELLRENNIRWNEEIRLGEDIIFLVEVLLASTIIKYTPTSFYFYDATMVVGKESSTQRYGEREMKNHAFVWQTVSQKLLGVGIDYWKIRGEVSLGTALNAIIKFGWEPLSIEALRMFHEALIPHAETIRDFSLRPRLKPLASAILEGRFEDFQREARLRLLVSGDDLKFISDGLAELRNYFEVRVDKWQGHEGHDDESSEELLQWADVIHCEWLLGNAVWYSRRKRSDQGLIVRGHRFEVTRPFGDRVNWSNVDVFQGVALPMVEDFARRFAVPREKLALVPNYVRDFGTTPEWSEKRRFKLCLIGAVPSRKGLHRALRVLASLRAIDPRYTLDLYGKRPEEMDWIWRNPEERGYFSECGQYAREHALESAVTWCGWKDTKDILQDAGFLLSVSDHEGSHVSVAEAMWQGVPALMLQWRGADYVYPSKYVFETPEEIAEAVLKLTTRTEYENFIRDGQEFCRNNYSLARFTENYIDCVRRSLS